MDRRDNSREKIADIDPRVVAVRERLKDVKRGVIVTSGKGGVGKTLIASTSAILLSTQGYEVGLLDLDFHGPTCHVVLGASDIIPKEDRGIIPPQVEGLKFMSIAYYAKDHPVPLRGRDITNAMIEIMAITRWNSLNFLLIDTPPGYGEEILDLIRLIEQKETLIVSTPSFLSIETVSKLIRLLEDMKVMILGIIENMSHGERSVEKLAKRYGINFLGSIPYDPKIEESLGKPRELLRTKFTQHLADIWSSIS